MRKVLICGPNGAGKSTLGRALGALSGWRFVDAEDYYFPRPGDYGFSRTKEEVAAMLLRDLRAGGDFIFASVKGDFGQEAVSRFTHAVLVCAPRDLRLGRVRERSVRRSGGLTETDRGFLAMVAARPEGLVEEWLAGLPLEVIRVDGTRAPEENAADILEWLGGR